MKAHPEMEREPRDWIRTHKNTGHQSRVDRTMVLHRFYFAFPEVPPEKAIALIDAGEPFETPYASYRKGK